MTEPLPAGQHVALHQRPSRCDGFLSASAPQLLSLCQSHDDDDGADDGEDTGWNPPYFSQQICRSSLRGQWSYKGRCGLGSERWGIRWAVPN